MLWHLAFIIDADKALRNWAAENVILTSTRITRTAAAKTQASAAPDKESRPATVGPQKLYHSISFTQAGHRSSEADSWKTTLKARVAIKLMILRR